MKPRNTFHRSVCRTTQWNKSLMCQVSQIQEETVEVIQPIPQDRMSDHVVQQTVDIPSPQTQEQTVESVQVHPKGLSADLQRGSNCGRASSTDSMTDSSQNIPSRIPAVQVAQKTVKELRSKFEVGHTNEVHARNQPDKNRWRKKQGLEAKQYPQDVQERADLTNQRQVPAIRSVQKTVEVPRVQYIDKVADISVDMQRQVSTIQAAQHIDEVVDVPAITQDECCSNNPGH